MLCQEADLRCMDKCVDKENRYRAYSVYEMKT